jgi:arabinofuranan 3-O-arabinosyltransferase
VCATGVARDSEDSTGIDRLVDVVQPGTFRVSVRGRIAAGPALDRLLAEHRTGVVAEASSSAVPDPAGQASSAVDGALGTGWIAAPGDRAPWLRFRWTGTRTIDGLRFVNDGALAASAPRVVTVDSPRGVRRGTLDKGVLRFDRPLSTTELTVRFGRADVASSIEPYTRQLTLLPVGTSEVTFSGAPELVTTHDPAERVVTPCGTGPTVRTRASVVRTAVSATYAQLADLGTVLLLPCGGSTVEVGAGPQRITAASSDLARTTGLELNRAGAPLPSQAPADRIGATVKSWGGTDRSVRVAARAEDALLVVRENSNAGWRATLDGRTLAPVTVDGWQQGYLVPEGAEGTVHLVYAPDRPYRVALLLGALAALAVLAAALGRRGQHPGPLPVQASRRAWVPAVVLGGAALVLAAGWWGVAAAVLAAVATQPLGIRATMRLRTVTLLGTLGVAGAALALLHWPSAGYVGRQWWVQLLCMVALGVLWASLLPKVKRGSASA